MADADPPDLEEPCPSCRGELGSTDSYGTYYPCAACEGAGTILTEFGAKVWAMVRRRLPGPDGRVIG